MINKVVTAKIQIYPDRRQAVMLSRTLDAYTAGCNYISEYVHVNHEFKQRVLQQENYPILRKELLLKSQMTQSVMKTVIARYKSLISNNHEWTKVRFLKKEYDLVFNRDYSLNKGLFSLNTINGRVKMKYADKAMGKYFDGTWNWGTAKIVQRTISKIVKWYLHIPMEKQFEELPVDKIKNVVGVDLGINYLATCYDSNGKITFYSGSKVKQVRGEYKAMRKNLQIIKSPSSRRKLKKIGQKENRWMRDVNHCISKALVDQFEPGTLFVIEDLTTVRTATVKVAKKNRYVSVSWAYGQLSEFLTYKAEMNNQKVVKIDPRYTSQTCPKSGHVDKSNRNKKTHHFCCKACGYQSNDDRVAAMNIRQKGVQYVNNVTERTCSALPG